MPKETGETYYWFALSKAESKAMFEGVNGTACEAIHMF
jgi:hypothetical protein